MSQSERDLLRRLGAGGLRRVLDDLLDAARLVRLANACGLRYPGMRTQSQKRETILADLVERAGREDAARRTILRALHKDTTAVARRFSALSPEERAARLADDGLLSASGALGLHLFLVAGAGSDEELAGLLRRCDAAPAPAPPEEPSLDNLARDASRLRKKNQELQKKVLYLDSQVAKYRETEKTLKRELLRRKGELAEARMLAERLRREAQSAKPAPTAGGPPGGRVGDPAGAPARGAEAALDEIARSVRKLGQDQKKIAHAVEKSAASPPARVEVPAEILAPILAGIEEIRKDASAARRERRKDEQQDRVLEELRAEVQALRSAAEEGPAPLGPAIRRRRGKGENARVGVFIDVQNVYYAARQLKGKLDFDALLQTVVRGRRLIQAKAYVVESQEIDQSGFIAMLQQRAIEVRRKTLKVRSDGSMKGDWDMEMALDILDAAPRLDVVVLVSGDGDFTSLVNRVKAMGPRVEVVAFPRNTAKSLLEAADEFQPLDRKFMIRSGAPETSPSAEELPAGTPR